MDFTWFYMYFTWFHVSSFLVFGPLLRVFCVKCRWCALEGAGAMTPSWWMAGWVKGWDMGHHGTWLLRLLRLLRHVTHVMVIFLWFSMIVFYAQDQACASTAFSSNFVWGRTHSPRFADQLGSHSRTLRNCDFEHFTTNHSREGYLGRLMPTIRSYPQTLVQPCWVEYFHNGFSFTFGASALQCPLPHYESLEELSTLGSSSCWCFI